MRSDTLGLIPAFHAVMTHGSLSAAARVLGLAQPTVRRQIELFEAELGTALFTRAANGLTPTAMAQTLLPMAQAVLDEAMALNRVASARAHALEGVVRLTASRIVATHVLPPVLAALQDTAPDLRYEIAATDDTQNLARRAADIAIRFEPPHQQALVAWKLPDVALGLFSAPEVPALEGIAALETAAFVMEDRAGRTSAGLAAVGAPQPRNVVLGCDDPLAVIEAVRAGLGTGVLQVKLGQRLGLRRQLPQISYPMPAWLVVHEDQAQIARIRCVFDHLKKELPEWI